MNYSFEIMNQGHSRNVLRRSDADGISLFLYSNAPNSQSSVYFIFDWQTPQGAIQLYQSKLFQHDLSLPRGRTEQADKWSVPTLKRSKEFFTPFCYRARDNPNAQAVGSSHNPSDSNYWNGLSRYGYHQTCSMSLSLSRTKHLVVGFQSTTSMKNLRVDRAMPAVEEWLLDARDFIVDTSLTTCMSGVSENDLAENLRKSSSALSAREAQVVCEVLKGLSNKEISSNLSLSEYTVENHLKRIYKKFGVKNRTALSAALNSKDFSI
ncbi:LuxR C-terminal-related transcriptional regulator [Halioxenophilus aromaticivorans]|uniref:HTH luxR-type domain-containing protein n=1 Tax=Halioxenophilus aromaticivorans TaxID=1306992 RepID=A0AAV3U4A3_9ALTE